MYQNIALSYEGNVTAEGIVAIKCITRPMEATRRLSL